MAEDKKLVDLKRSKAEKKERQEAIKSMPMEGEDYSYGTRLHLGEHELDKLGHDANPEVGTEHHFFVKGRVTQSSHDQDEGGDPRRSITVQVTHMSPMTKAAKDKSVRDEIEEGVKAVESKVEDKAGADDGAKTKASGARALNEKD